MAAMDGAITGEIVAARAAAIRERIGAAGGDASAIRLVAVTKGFGPEVVQAALDAGLMDLGENYAQELVPKAERLAALRPGPSWHFMGRLQTNKVRMLAPHIALWQSVDRPGLLREIANRVPGAGVLIQVNITGEPQKGGCEPLDVPALVDLGRELELDVRGLMGVGPVGPPASARPAFDLLVSLAEDVDVEERSIGMSSDLEVAVAAGATMVRVGRDLFGPRPAPAEAGG